jgi:glycosyltransferase involved in cell wall biosynthesis
LAHRILVNSEAVRKQVSGAGRAASEKVVLIRNGLTPPENGLGFAGWKRAIREQLLRELHLDPGVLLVGMVARLMPEKGHRFLLEAARQVCGRWPNVHFVLVGKGSLQSEIEAQAARLGIADRVHLLGFRPDSATLAGAFDLAVLPSLHEGLPNAVLEAMAAGVAVLGTSAGGTKELISHGRTGWMAPPAAAEALAERILFALEHGQERAAVALRARRFALSTYGMDRMVREVEQLYERMVEQV